MKNTNENTQNTKTNTVVTKERFKEIQNHFKGFVKDKGNWSYKCETYGTKYEGKLRFEHYLIYSILRGRKPEENSHDINSESYKEEMSYLEGLSQGRGTYGKSMGHACSAFAMTEDEMKSILSQYFN